MPTLCLLVSVTVKLNIGILIHIPGFLVDYTILKGMYQCQVRGGTGAEWAGVEWNYSGMDGV